MKKFVCALLVFILVLSFTACSKFDENYVYDGKSLIGKWCEEDYNESYYLTYEFFDNDTVLLNEYYYGIEYSSTLAKATIGKNTIDINVTGFNGAVTNYHQKFCITEDGELVFIYLSDKDQITEEELVLVPYEPKFNKDNSPLVGKWEDTQNPGEYWSFNKDYTGNVEGAGKAGEINSYNLYYSLLDDKIYLAFEFVPGVKQSIVEFDYEIDGNTLTLENDSLTYVFERK